MKRIPLLLCAAVLAAMPVATQAGGLAFGQASDGLSVGLGVGLLMGQQDDDRRHRHHEDNGEHRGEDRRGDDRRGEDRRDDRYNAPPPPPAYGGDDRRDDRIGRAMAIGRGQGTVINAWPQGGSLFLVRVNTSRGRVDMIVDVDSGRIVGER